MMSYNLAHIEGHAVYKSDMALALFKLDQFFFPTPWSEDAWLNLFQEGMDKNLIVLLNQEEIIGFSLFELVPADSFAHLVKILVAPQFRGKGLSKKLMTEAMTSLKNAGLKHYFLEVEAENYAAQKLYLSQDFKVIHKKKDFYGNGRDALIMTLDFS